MPVEKMPEGKFVELVDASDKVVGTAPRKLIHKKPLPHRAVHVWVFNALGELFLQKRPSTMELCPSMWDSSVGEHVEIGETYRQAAQRGLKEELHIRGTKPKRLSKKLVKHKNAHEMITLFATTFGEKIKINKKELAGGKFFSKAEIIELVKKKKTTPFFNVFFKKWFK